jgi:hypothetical protein
VSFTVTGNDAEDGGKTPVCDATSGQTFAIGTTTVHCSVTDVAGATASDAFTVVVQDTTAPSIAAHADISLAATSPAGAVVGYTSPAWTDAVDGSGATSCTPASGSTFTLGAHTVTCTATDAHGNPASSSFSVTVTNTAPTISVPGPLSAEATGASGAAVTFSVTGNDAEDGVKTPVCDATSGQTFAIGTTTVHCSVTDVAGATTPGSFNVTVTDTTKPAVTITVNGSPYEQTSPAGAAGTFTASASDIVDGGIAVTCTATSGATFPRGTTNFSCTATDAHGNTGTASASIVVRDTIKPVVTYTGSAGTYTSDQNVSITCGAADGGSGVASSTCADISGPAYSFGDGPHAFSATATDVAGNVGTASVTFTVTTTAAATATLVDQFVTNTGVAGGLTAKLEAAASAANANARAGHLNAFINQVNAQIGKTLTAAQAAILIAQAQLLF